MFIGHAKQQGYFGNLIKNGTLSHAYLFSGPEQVGKKVLAYEIFEMLNKRHPENDPDFKLLEPMRREGQSKIYIEEIRNAKKFFSRKPYYGPYKVMVVDDAHTLTNEASNAFLKLLEEPSQASLILLISSMPGTLPKTILSRCEEVKFLLAFAEEVSDYLNDKKISKEDKDFITILSCGRIGLINSFLEDKEKIKEAKKIINDLRSLFTKGAFERMNYAKKVHESGDYQPRISYWLNWVSAHLAPSTGGSSKNKKIVKNLLFLNSLVSQPQYNHRLALENFLLEL